MRVVYNTRKVNYDQVTISGNTISGNSAQQNVGGLYVFNSSSKSAKLAVTP